MPAPHEQSAHAELAQMHKRQMRERDDLRSKHERERTEMTRRHNEEDTKDRRHRAYPEARMVVRAGEQGKLRLQQKKEYEALRDRHRQEIGHVAA